MVPAYAREPTPKELSRVGAPICVDDSSSELETPPRQTNPKVLSSFWSHLYCHVTITSYSFSREEFMEGSASLGVQMKMKTKCFKQIFAGNDEKMCLSSMLS